MKRDLEFALPEVSASGALRSPITWACLLAVAGILAVHWDTAASIVAIWIRSETFAHGFFVIPICVWLAWRKRGALAEVPAQPWWPGLVFVGISGALWLVASAADALGARQFALAFMLQAAIITVVGLRMARVLAFAVAFLLFAVPFGEIFVPTLIDWTADFTVAALRFSGVPVFREVNQFIIPTGAWSVVEACSGVRYVIASLMVGTLYAAIAYRSARKRVYFMAAALLVPIVANWLRAYMIVMIGHLSNNRLATGVDHIIYGWVFFGIVMLLLFWIGAFWQEGTQVERRKHQFTPNAAVTTSAPWSLFLVPALAAIAMVSGWRPIATSIHEPTSVNLPSLASISSAKGWSATSGAITDWKPHYSGEVVELAQTFEKGDWQAGIYIEYYRSQTKGHELITSANVLVTPENSRWKQTSRGERAIDWSGARKTVGSAELAARDSQLELLHFFWIDGRVTANPYVGKAWQAWSRLTGRGDDAALVVLYAPFDTMHKGRRESLGDFASAIMPGIESALLAARRSGR
jgi:exosortase A